MSFDLSLGLFGGDEWCLGTYTAVDWSGMVHLIGFNHSSPSTMISTVAPKDTVARLPSGGTAPTPLSISVTQPLVGMQWV